MKTKSNRFSLFLVGLMAVVSVASTAATAAADDAKLDLRRAVPAEAHMVILGMNNPEREYQDAYLADILQTVQDERLVERFLEIITSKASEEDLAGVKSVFQEIQTAMEPIDWQAIADMEEVVYAQQMETPFNHHLVLLRLTDKDTEACEAAYRNLLGMLEGYSHGEASLQIEKQGDVEITTIGGLPKQMPFSPALARVDDVLLFSSSESILRNSLAMLQGGGGKSKFDDPRLIEALTKLPKPEDSLVFFDGQMLFEKLGKIGDFIRQESHGDQEAEQVAQVVELMIDECAIIDYAVAVEYTEGYRNCSVDMSKMLPGSGEKLLAKAVSGQQPFERWQSWVPADAVAYSVSTGINLHAVYDRIIELTKAECPEADGVLEQFEQIQEQIGVYLDRDILQSFPGETVSVSLPSGAESPMGGPDSVTALRCTNPERIKELLHRLVDTLSQHPAVQAQQLQLTESDELEGFEELQCLLFGMVGVQPVIGFQDGWMIVGSRASAVQQVLDARAGETTSIDTTEGFQKFQLKVEGPVQSLSYTNLAESIHNTADGIRQAGTMAPMVLGILGAQGDPEAMKPVLEVVGLLPSVAKVVEKFDFMESKLSVTQQGDDPDTYVTRTVTLIRPPAEDGE